jgi:hypothetical protein
MHHEAVLKKKKKTFNQASQEFDEILNRPRSNSHFFLPLIRHDEGSAVA